MSALIWPSNRAVGLSALMLLASAVLIAWLIPLSMGATAPAPKKLLRILPRNGDNLTVAKLGESLFNDPNLSNPPGQSCASCHSPSAGYTFPDENVNKHAGVAQGAVKGRFENRAPPSLTYAAFLPQGPPQFTSTAEAFVGGLFWDGRASNLQDQVATPLQNPNEMNNTLHGVGDPAAVVRKVQSDNNAWMLRQLYGDQVFSRDTATVFQLITGAIAAYEATPQFSPFSSKYDQWLHGKARLSASELRGLQLMTGSTTGRPGGPANYKNAHCVDCHGISRDVGGIDLWTNSCYDNIGVPKNPENPYYRMTDAQANPAGYNPQGFAYVDLGLGGSYYPSQYKLPPGNTGPGSNGQGDFLGINGSFKAPSLRNVDKRPYSGFIKSYTHNGYFKDLKTIVHFYNTRNLTTARGEVIDFTQKNPYAHLKGSPLWPIPEYSNFTTLQNASGAFNSAGAQVGNLGLNDSEENDLVAFMKALTDGYGQSFSVELPVAPIDQTPMNGPVLKLVTGTSSANPGTAISVPSAKRTPAK